MLSTELAAMATLDRKRISSQWKSTMPNKYLMQQLIKRCQGKFIIMNEDDIQDGPSSLFKISELPSGMYEEMKKNDGEYLYKQYNLQID